MSIRRMVLACAVVGLISAPARSLAAARGPSPRIELPPRHAPPATSAGLDLRVSATLIAKPDFEAMGHGPRQAGSATLRLRAEVVALPGNLYGLRPGIHVDGLALASVVRGVGQDRVLTNSQMEWIPCQGGPHYEATFILDRPGLYEVTVEPALVTSGPVPEGRDDAPGSLAARAPADVAAAESLSTEDLDAQPSSPLAGRSLPHDLSARFTADFTMPDEDLEKARLSWERSTYARGVRNEHASAATRSETGIRSRTGREDPAGQETAGSSGTRVAGHGSIGNPDWEGHAHHRGQRMTRRVFHSTEDADAHPEPGASFAEPVSDDMTLLLNWDTRTSYSAGCGYADATGKFAVVGSTDGTQIVEVTDPLNPVEWGFIPGCSSSWRECKTYGTYAYMTTEQAGCGMQIINLSNPRAPSLASTYTATFTTSHTVFINQDTGIMYVNGTKLNGAFAGVQIFDLNAAPVNLVRIASFTTRYVHDSYEALDPFTGTYKLYLSEIYNGLEEVYDDTVKTSLSRLGSWATPQNFTHNSAVNPSHTVMMTTDEINTGGSSGIYDVSNPASPVLVSTYRGGGPETIIHNVHFDDGDPDLVWAAHYTQGVRLVDLHRPSFPLEIGHYDTYPPLTFASAFDGCWEAWPYDRDGWAYLFDRQTGLYVVQHDPSGGRLSGVVRGEATGAPIVGASVLEMESGTFVRTNAFGVYAMRLPAGPARLRVSGYGGYTIEASVTVAVGEHTDLDVELPALPASPLTGFVKRAGDLAPIPGALVRNLASGQTATTAGDGSFAFADVPLGTHRLTVSQLGFAPNQVLVLLGPTGVVAADPGEALGGEEGAGPGAAIPGTGVTILLDPARWFDDAEIDRGWSLGVSDTADASGRWVRTDPNGTDGALAQTEDDHTPSPASTCFVTGNGAPGGAAELNDVDLGITNLVSPTLDATGLGSAAIDYWRWFSNARGSNQSGYGTLTVEVSNNNGTSWVNLESVSKEANAWTSKFIDLGSRVGLTSLMKIRVRASAGSASTTGVVEAALDDVQLVKACVARLNPLAANADGDGLVTACDACPSDPLNDVDGDGVCGNVDRSPFQSDPAQSDADGDLVGDAADNCPFVANADQVDNDRDATGNACDADDDNDGTADAADADDDGDGVVDASDNCPGLSNAAQINRDAPAAGDACDPDDGVVTGLRFLGKTTLTWDRENGASTYNLYRGEVGIGAEALVPQASCLAKGLVTAFASDPELPNPGDPAFYLATAVVGGTERGFGYTSAGAARVILVHCP